MYNKIQHILDSQQLTLNMAYQDIFTVHLINMFVLKSDFYWNKIG